MKKLMTLVCVACAALLVNAAAAPKATGVKMKPTKDGRRVVVRYSLGAPAIVTLDVQTKGADGTWTSIGGEHLRTLKGDVGTKVRSGDHKITWKPDADAPWSMDLIKKGEARAVVTAWTEDDPPDYLVVDLAATEPGSQAYYPGAAFLPGGLLENDEYRTSKLVMRKIAAKGVAWTMGSDKNEPGHGAGEAQHPVTLDENYYIGVFPVTQAQWALVQTTRPSPSYFTGDAAKRPVEMVSYVAIRTLGNPKCEWPQDPNPGSFLGMLRAKTGLAFDLPSDAQWEFACRAGHGSGKWNDGSQILCGPQGDTRNDENLKKLGRFYYNGGFVKGQDAAGNEIYSWPTNRASAVDGTAVVGSYAPSSWGLYDMHGNVWEWCLDWYEEDISDLNGAVNVREALPGKTLSGAKGTDRIVRGGGWFSGYAYDCRSARRWHYRPDFREGYTGFRVALPLK